MDTQYSDEEKKVIQRVYSHCCIVQSAGIPSHEDVDAFLVRIKPVVYKECSPLEQNYGVRHTYTFFGLLGLLISEYPKYQDWMELYHLPKKGKFKSIMISWNYNLRQSSEALSELGLAYNYIFVHYGLSDADKFLTIFDQVLQIYNLGVRAIGHEFDKSPHFQIVDRWRREMEERFTRSFRLHGEPKVKTVLPALKSACLELLANVIDYRRGEENYRNRYLASILRALFPNLSDQSQRGFSETGIKHGEVDILIKYGGSLTCVIECMDLKSISKGWMITHLDRVFGYDVIGEKENFIVSYCKAANFDGLYERYKRFVVKHEYKYRCEDYAETDRRGNFRVFKTIHDVNGVVTTLYHILINIAQTAKNAKD